ncbi:MAG: hypothetical protein H6839_00125 [Planctomycetes bacterium]|nr:hypothetical protein [Planctomycetota bacterium]
MPNMYAQTESRERVTQDAADLAVHHNGVWVLDLVGTILGVLFWWR